MTVLMTRCISKQAQLVVLGQQCISMPCLNDEKIALKLTDV